MERLIEARMPRASIDALRGTAFATSSRHLHAVATSGSRAAPNHGEVGKAATASAIASGRKPRI